VTQLRHLSPILAVSTIMASDSRRSLFKGQLLPPKREPWSQSYTVNPISKDHIGVKSRRNDKVSGRSWSDDTRVELLISGTVIEFSSGAVPMPFLDPAVLSRRIQEEKEWKEKQDRESKIEGSSQEA